MLNPNDRNKKKIPLPLVYGLWYDNLVSGCLICSLKMDVAPAAEYVLSAIIV